MLAFCRCQQYPIDVYYHGYREKWKEMKMIFRLFSYFAEFVLKSVIMSSKKNTWFHLKKWSWIDVGSAPSPIKIGWSSITAFSNTETFVWNIFGYDQWFEWYRSVTLSVPHPVYTTGKFNSFIAFEWTDLETLVLLPGISSNQLLLYQADFQKKRKIRQDL